MLGRQLKEARDFEQLSHLLLSHTRERLSPTTLKRFWGYLKNEEVQTRPHTLDVLACFVGYKDFEDFCNKVSLNEHDFMFLDPPYDTEFSTYAQNDFGKDDQIRLANYLKKTKAKFMLVIKNTEFIYSLYKDSGFNIKSFDKKYLVSFMNRNDKDVEHLLITNY